MDVISSTSIPVLYLIQGVFDVELMDILLVCLIAFVTAGITGITGVAAGCYQRFS